MIDSHFSRSLARDEPISALFAAEPAIYGRYGYGSACDDAKLKLSRGAALREVPGADELTVTLATADVTRHGALVDAVHRAAGAGRPGWTTRDSDAWRTRVLADPPAWRQGAEPLRIVTVHDAAGEARGYGLFRRKDNWGEGGPAGTVKVREAVAVDAAATHRLWSFLLDLDLTATVESPMLPVDDALLHLLVDQRAVVPKLTDNLWVRLLDLPGRPGRPPVLGAGRRGARRDGHAPDGERGAVAADHRRPAGRRHLPRRGHAHAGRRRPAARRPRARCRLPGRQVAHRAGPRRSRDRA